LVWGAAGSLWRRPQRRDKESERADAAYAYYAVDSMTRKLLTYPRLAKG
jgi:hypothetical protein